MQTQIETCRSIIYKNYKYLRSKNFLKNSKCTYNMLFTITTGDNEDPFVLDVLNNELSLSEELDREEIDEYNFIIHAKNDLIGFCQPPTNPNLESSSNLKVKVLVQDVKDTQPFWPIESGSILSGGIRTDAKIDETSIILRANDLDLNETLTYSLGTTIDRSDPTLVSIPTQTPFEISNGNEIRIKFQPQASMKGFFNFSVFVYDSGRIFKYNLLFNLQ